MRLTHGPWRRRIQTAGTMTQTQLSMIPTGHFLRSASVLAITRRHPRDTPRLHSLAGDSASNSQRNTLLVRSNQWYSTHIQFLARTRPKPQFRWRHHVLSHNPYMALRHLSSRCPESWPSRGTRLSRDTILLLRIRKGSLCMLLRNTRSTTRDKHMSRRITRFMSAVSHLVPERCFGSH